MDGGALGALRVWAATSLGAVCKAHGQAGALGNVLACDEWGAPL